MIERRDANEKLYNSRITASQLLEGGVRPPAAAEPLMRILNSRVFAGVANQANDSMYNDIPIYDDSHENVDWDGRQGQQGNWPSGRAAGASPISPTGEYEYRDRPQRSSTWADDLYDRQPRSNNSISRSNTTRANPNETFDRLVIARNRPNSDDYSYSNPKPGRPTAPKPQFKPKPANLSASKKDQAIALFTFDADQPGDLAFRKGEVITITKRTENSTDWWTGRIGDRTGIFPRYAMARFFFESSTTCPSPRQSHHPADGSSIYSNYVEAL